MAQLFFIISHFVGAYFMQVGYRCKGLKIYKFMIGFLEILRYFGSLTVPSYCQTFSQNFYRSLDTYSKGPTSSELMKVAVHG